MKNNNGINNKTPTNNKNSNRLKMTNFQNKSTTYDYNSNLISYYPYGELPLKYTKSGQEQLKREIEQNRNHAFTKAFLEPEQNNQNNSGNINNLVETMGAMFGANQNTATNNFLSNVSAQNTTQNNNNSNNSGNNLDINALLPLLSNLGGNNANLDLIKTILPLLSSNKTPDMNELLKLFGSLAKPKAKTTKTKILSEDTTIDSLKKVE